MTLLKVKSFIDFYLPYLLLKIGQDQYYNSVLIILSRFPKR